METILSNLGLEATGHMAASERPNLLLITTDQQRWDALSAYGTPGYRTPVLDRLASEGLLFDRTYCPSPICTPTRVSLLTGQYPSRHGAYTIGMEPVRALDGPILPRLLSAAGYRTAIIGKTHFVARPLEGDHVAGRKDPDDSFWDSFNGPYLGFDVVRHCATHTLDRPPECHYRAWLRRKGLNLDHLHWPKDRKKNGENGLPHYGRWAIPEEQHQTAWITEEAVNFISREQSEQRPWFCWVSHQDPHPPYVCPEPYYSAVDMTGVDLGGAAPGEFDDKPPFYKRITEGKYWSDNEREFMDHINVPAAVFAEVNDIRPAIQAYIGMTNMVDVYIGRLLAQLEKLGARENTLIVFSSDHGEYLNQHGFWQKGLPAYDDAQRVPGIVNWPAGHKSAQRGKIDAAFSLVDVAPTFLDAAGLPPAAGMQGISQLPVLRGEKAAARDWAIVELQPTKNVYQQTFVSGGCKLVVYRDADYGELYDLRNDPRQMANLWNRAGCAGLRAEMMHKFARALMEKDGVLPARLSSA